MNSLLNVTHRPWTEWNEQIDSSRCDTLLEDTRRSVELLPPGFGTYILL